MARARNIKPGFFANEDLVELPFAVRLLFIGLWTLADREGRLEDRPKRIKMALFPADDINVDAALNDLARAGFLTRYEVDGSACIQVEQFVKHQNPHHMEAPSVLPPKPGHDNRYNHTPISPKQRARIYERDGHKCSTCESVENLQIDHIRLVSDGGTSDDDNLRTLCAQCNNKRSKKPKSQANPADPLSLDSGFLIPDSGFTDSPIPESSAPPPAEGKPTKAKQVKEQAPTNAVWQAYNAAYRAKYGVEPVRNAAVNGQLSQVVARLGVEAAHVAEFYLSHRNRFYVEKMHPVGLLLSDAEKLRTEWATGRQVTSTQALQTDKTQATLSAFAPMLAEAQAKEQMNAQR